MKTESSRKDLEKFIDADGFNWENHDIDIEDIQIKQINVEDTQGNIFKFLLKAVYYILGVEAIILFVSHIFGIDLLVHLGVETVLTLYLFLIPGLYAMCLHVLYMILHQAAKYFELNQHFERNVGTIQLIMLMLWFFCITIFKNDMKYGDHYFYRLLMHFVTCGIWTVVFLIISDIFLRRFQSYFIRESLKYKIKEAQKTEAILTEMVGYSLDNYSHSSETSIIGAQCGSVFWDHLYDRNSNTSKFFSTGMDDLLIERPVLQNVNVAIELARDCFLKAAKGREELGFEQFTFIFRHAKLRQQAFAYFDSNQDRLISKKEFRDTVLHFYRERCTLSDSIDSTKGFTVIINRIWYLMTFFLLMIICLVIFGIPLAKIATVLISSAVAFNVMIGDLCSTMVKNFTMLVSHQFDIGDDVIVDGEDLKVYEIGLSTTSFITVQGGKLKIENVDLSTKKVINMTKAPEKNITFTFELPARVSIKQLKILRGKVHEFLQSRNYDFLDNFEMINQKSAFTKINLINCTLILKCNGHKNKAKKFILRVEFTHYLREVLQELDIFVSID